MAVPDASPRPDSSASQSSISPSASCLVSGRNRRGAAACGRARRWWRAGRRRRRWPSGLFESGLCAAEAYTDLWAEADHNQAGNLATFVVPCGAEVHVGHCPCPAQARWGTVRPSQPRRLGEVLPRTRPGVWFNPGAAIVIGPVWEYTACRENHLPNVGVSPRHLAERGRENAGTLA